MSFDAKAVKRDCNGMLSEAVYASIHGAALAAPAGNFIEVGAAHGGGTVTLALALKAKGGPAHKVYSFEKIVGGSREKFGSIDRNKQIIEGNLRKFGVADQVEMLYGDVRDECHRIPAEGEFGLMMLDADGRLDRDFALFFDRLAPGAPVIIDDVHKNARVKRVKGLVRQHLRIDQKHRISKLLVNLFTERGLIEGKLHEVTFIGRKIPGSRYAQAADSVIECYHDLVFSDVVYRGALGEYARSGVGRHLPPAIKRALKGPE